MNIDPDEALLIARCRKKDPEAIQTLVFYNGPPVYSLFQIALGPRVHLIHPILVDAFADLIRRRHPKALREPFLMVLMRTVIKKVEEELGHPSAQGPLKGLSPQLALVFEGVSQLSWEDRLLILLRDRLEFSKEEIGAILSMRQDRISARLQYARIRLREIIQYQLDQERKRRSEMPRSPKKHT